MVGGNSKRNGKGDSGGMNLCAFGCNAERKEAFTRDSHSIKTRSNDSMSIPCIFLIPFLAWRVSPQNTLKRFAEIGTNWDLLQTNNKDMIKKLFPLYHTISLHIYSEIDSCFLGLESAIYELHPHYLVPQVPSIIRLQHKATELWWFEGVGAEI